MLKSTLVVLVLAPGQPTLLLMVEISTIPFKRRCETPSADGRALGHMKGRNRPTVHK